jgi:type I restriction enzyme R subunit
LLNQLLQDQKDGKLEYKEMIARLISKIREVRGKTKPDYPTAINSSGKQALYDNLEEDEELALAVHEAVVTYAKHGWRDNNVPAKMKQVRKAVRNALPEKDDEKISQIMGVISSQKEY